MPLKKISRTVDFDLGFTKKQFLVGLTKKFNNNLYLSGGLATHYKQWNSSEWYMSLLKKWRF